MSSTYLSLHSLCLLERITRAFPLLHRVLPQPLPRSDIRRGWNPRNQNRAAHAALAASQSPDGRDRGAATRLSLVSTRLPGVALRSTRGYSPDAATRQSCPGSRTFWSAVIYCRFLRRENRRNLAAGSWSRVGISRQKAAMNRRTPKAR
jgi:hypothetical protein